MLTSIELIFVSYNREQAKSIFFIDLGLVSSEKDGISAILFLCPVVIFSVSSFFC